ncbi:MAG: hypothetical protein ACRET1_06925, partial [Burkholderiales bacterium]
PLRRATSKHRRRREIRINRQDAKNAKDKCDNRRGAEGRKGKPDSNKKFFAAFLCAFAPLRLGFFTLSWRSWRLGGECF